MTPNSPPPWFLRKSAEGGGELEEIILIDFFTKHCVKVPMNYFNVLRQRSRATTNRN